MRVALRRLHREQRATSVAAASRPGCSARWQSGGLDSPGKTRLRSRLFGGLVRLIPLPASTPTTRATAGPCPRLVGARLQQQTLFPGQEAKVQAEARVRSRTSLDRFLAVPTNLGQAKPLSSLSESLQWPASRTKRAGGCRQFFPWWVFAGSPFKGDQSLAQPRSGGC